MTDKLDLGECLLLDADNLPPAIYLSPDPTKHQMTDILCLFNLKLDKLRFPAVPAGNANDGRFK